MKKILMAGFTSILLLAILLAGCAGGVEKQTSSSEQISKIIIGTTNTFSYSLGYTNVLNGAFNQEGLIGLDPEGQLVPRLAESWEMKDPKTMVFHLVKNATWHDGTPFTSKDVKYVLDSAKKTSPKAFISTKVASVETPDDYTAILNLNTPVSVLSIGTNFNVRPEHIWKDVSDPTKYNDIKATIGTGPYEFVKFDEDAGIILYKAYDKYYGGRPAIDEIEVRLFKNQDTMIMALEKGELDTVFIWASGINYFYVPKLLQGDNVKILLANNIAIPAALWFNTGKAPYNNSSLRNAISYAINYEDLKNLIAGGYGSIPDAGFLPKGTPNFIETRELAYDPEKAKSLLNSSGFMDVDGDGFREMQNGSKFQPVIIVRNDMLDLVRAAGMIETYLNDVGIGVQVKALDPDQCNNLAYYNKLHDIGIFGTVWGAMFYSPGYAASYFDYKGTGYANVHDPRFIALEEQLLNTTDPEKAAQLGADIQNYYASELPAIALYWNTMIFPYNTKYEGWTIDPRYGILSYGTYFNLHKA